MRTQSICLFFANSPMNISWCFLSIKSCDVKCNCLCKSQKHDSNSPNLNQQRRGKSFPRKPFKATNQLTDQLITCFCNAKYFLSKRTCCYSFQLFVTISFIAKCEQIKCFFSHFDYFIIRAATNCAFAWDMFWWFNQSLIL